MHRFGRARTATMSAEARSRDSVAFSTSPLLPIDNGWLRDVSAKLRMRQTPWEGFQRADLVTSDELPMLREAEQAGQQGHMDAIVQRGAEYARMYIQLLSKLNRAETIQSVVLLVNDLMQAAPAHIAWFVDAEPYTALKKALEVDDLFVSLKAAQFLTLCACTQAAQHAKYGSVPSDVVDTLLTYIKQRLVDVGTEPHDGAEGNVAPIVLCLAAELMRSPFFRRVVWEKDTTARAKNSDALIARLVSILHVSMTSNVPANKASGNTGVPQLHYLVLFALWELTFYDEAAQGLDVQFGVATPLVHMAQKTLKEKVARLIAAIWRNMLVADEGGNAARLLGAKVLPLCDTLEERRYSDTELQEDLAYVQQVLAQHLEQMSSYEQYKSELYSGHLSFDNPAHMLEDFWKENAEKLTEHNSEDLAQLVSLLQDSSADSTTLAAACSDIGKFVQHLESGRRRADALGAKTAIMHLVEHADDNVKYHALQTLAIFVSSSWR